MTNQAPTTADHRLRVFINGRDGEEFRATEAYALAGVTPTHVHRLLRRYEREGAIRRIERGRYAVDHQLVE